jgi:hypothetical protein
MLQPVTIDKFSPFLGEECALCKDPLTPGDVAIICPADGSRHHDRCWTANGNKCAAYGCQGHGEIILSSSPSSPAHPSTPSPAHPLSSTPLPLHPPVHYTLANSCLILAIAIAIILCAVGCFGLWAIADYLMLHFWHLPYRAPFSGVILPWVAGGGIG